MLSLPWIPTADNGVATAISRPSKDRHAVGPNRVPAGVGCVRRVQYRPHGCTASTQRSPLTGDPLPFFSRYDCEGSRGLDVLAQGVAVLPGTAKQTFGFCFLPPVMAGHVVQHLAECRAHAVMLVSDQHAFWFPAVRAATVRLMVVSPRAPSHYIQWPSPWGSMKGWRYQRWAMVAYELDLSS